jgi:hypothetical protein
MSKTIHVKVKLTIADDADGLDVVQEMDYSMVHDGILDTEIVDVEIPDEVDTAI